MNSWCRHPALLYRPTKARILILIRRFCISHDELWFARKPIPNHVSCDVGAAANDLQLSNSMIPRALRAGPSSDQSVSSSDDITEQSTSNEVWPGESQSVINGMERTTMTDSEEANIGNVRVGRMRSHRHNGALKAKTDAYVDYANKTLGPEQLDFMVQQLEKKADPRLRRTYTNGKPLEEVIDSAPVLTVGLVFLPGADKPQVNRSEQFAMEGKEADQKDALWRVATAGSLLSQFNVSQDLSIEETDQTASIVKTAKFRAHDRDRGFLDQRKALTRRHQDQDTVTIDSEKVIVVNDLSDREFDLRGLLVEVDWSSLWDLITDYRTLIARGGPEMTFEETKDLLETIIENARRLCIRSPILFRMSTRSRIIHSENTRYGINQGPMFKTLTTSKGIKEMISLSAAYYIR